MRRFIGRRSRVEVDVQVLVCPAVHLFNGWHVGRLDHMTYIPPVAVERRGLSYAITASIDLGSQLVSHSCLYDAVCLWHKMVAYCQAAKQAGRVLAPRLIFV